MTRDHLIWIWTPLFSKVAGAAAIPSREEIHILRYDPRSLREMLLTFRAWREQVGPCSALVMDIATFPDEQDWAYVADGIGKSGSNPLRGLGPLLHEPFVDVSRLYHLRQGTSGITVMALGDRYLTVDTAALAARSSLPVCSHLQEAAILAHAEGFSVTGVLLAEHVAPHFDFGQVLEG